MRKLLLCGFVVVAVAIIVGYLWVATVASSYMTTNQGTSKRAVDQIDLHCPNASSLISRPWGKSGWSALCVRDGVPHGPWFAIEAGRFEIRGAYMDGDQCGSWQWVNPDGSVLKRETFSACSDSGSVHTPLLEQRHTNEQGSQASPATGSPEPDSIL